MNPVSEEAPDDLLHFWFAMWTRLYLVEMVYRVAGFAHLAERLPSQNIPPPDDGNPAARERDPVPGVAGVNPRGAAPARAVLCLSGPLSCELSCEPAQPSPAVL